MCCEGSRAGVASGDANAGAGRAFDVVSRRRRCPTQGSHDGLRCTRASHQRMQKRTGPGKSKPFKLVCKNTALTTRSRAAKLARQHAPGLNASRAPPAVGASCAACGVGFWRLFNENVRAPIELRSDRQIREGSPTTRLAAAHALPIDMGSDDETFYSAAEEQEDDVISVDDGEWQDCVCSYDNELEIAAVEELQLPSVTTATIDHVCALAGLAQEDVAQRLVARRFAVANGGDEGKASQQLRESRDWILQMRPHLATVPVCNNPLMQRVGWDRLGHPLLAFNGLALNRTMRSGDEALRYACATIEDALGTLQEDRLPPRRNIQKASLLLYLPRGSEPDLRKAAPLLRSLQRYYPECVYRLLIFPVSPWTPFFWNILKTFVEPRTARKVVFLEGGSAPPGLAEFVAPEHLPRDFGGLGNALGWCTPPSTP